MRGVSYYEYSQRVGGDIDELLERFEASRGEVQGHLKISSLIYVGRHLVQPAVAAYLAEYP